MLRLVTKDQRYIFREHLTSSKQKCNWGLFWGINLHVCMAWIMPPFLFMGGYLSAAIFSKECVVGWQVEALSGGGGLSMLECASFEGWVFWWRWNSTWNCDEDEVKGQVIVRYGALNDRATYVGAWCERVCEEDTGTTEWVDMSDLLAPILCLNWVRAIAILTLDCSK